MEPEIIEVKKEHLMSSTSFLTFLSPPYKEGMTERLGGLFYEIVRSKIFIYLLKYH